MSTLRVILHAISMSVCMTLRANAQANARQQSTVSGTCGRLRTAHVDLQRPDACSHRLVAPTRQRLKGGVGDKDAGGGGLLRIGCLLVVGKQADDHECCLWRRIGSYMCLEIDVV